MPSSKTASFTPWRWKIIFQLSNATLALYRKPKPYGATTFDAHNSTFARKINRLNTLLSGNCYDKGHWSM